MPKLWNDTIDEHRRAVRNATLDVTAALVAEHGVRGVTMARIASEAGIGRATLYKYWPDVESILSAWHERHVDGHLEELARVRDRATGAHGRLAAVLRSYAVLSRGDGHTHGPEIAAVLHRGEHMAAAHDRLRGVVRKLVADAAADGCVRDDVDPSELADYALHALSAAPRARSRAAVERLVDVTLAGLRPPS